MSMNVKVSVRQVRLWQRKQARALMNIIREDVIVDASKGIGPTGGQYVPYETPGEEARPVNLTQSGAMLEGVKVKIRKTTGVLVPSVFYAKFQNAGTKAHKGKRGGSIPARPFLVLRPRTVKKIRRWTERTLNQAFNATSLRDTFNTGGVI